MNAHKGLTGFQKVDIPLAPTWKKKLFSDPLEETGSLMGADVKMFLEWKAAAVKGMFVQRTLIECLLLC